MDLSPIGSRIKTARENKKITQEELAAMVDLSPTHISVIERGVKPPKLETFVRIANALGVSADSLLVDVVDNSTKGIACELYDYVSNLSKKERESTYSCTCNDGINIYSSLAEIGKSNSWINSKTSCLSRSYFYNLSGEDFFMEFLSYKNWNQVQYLSIIHSYLASNLRFFRLLYRCKPKKGELQYEKY